MSQPSDDEPKLEDGSDSPRSMPKDEPSSIDDIEYPSGLTLAIIIAALMLAIFLISLDTTIISTAIPRITDDFHTVTDIGWYGSAFFLTLASFQGSWGKIYRHFALKYSFIASVALFEVGSLICAVAQNSVTLIVGRAIAGMGAAGISSGSYTILAFSTRPEKRAVMTGAIGASFAVASVAGPLIGGAFTQNSTWRWCFWVNLPLGGLAAGLILVFFHTPTQSQVKDVQWKTILFQLDFSGIVLLLGAILCFLLALQWGGTTKPWKSASVVGCLVGFGVILVLFCVNEAMLGDAAMIPPRLLKQKTVAFCSAYTSFFSGSFYLLLYYLPIYFQSAKGASAANSGVRMVPLVLGNGLFATISGIILGIIGYYMPLLTLAGVMSTIASGLLYTLGLTSGPNEWIGYQALAGIGIGLGIQVPIMASQAIVEVQDLSTISAIILFFQCIGGAISVQAAQAAFNNKLVQEIHRRLPDLSTALITSTGATELTTKFNGEQLPIILDAYVSGLKVCFIISIVFAAIATLLSLFSGWRRLGKMGAAERAEV